MMGFENKKKLGFLQSSSFLQDRSFLFSSLEETESAKWAEMPQVTKEMKALISSLKKAQPSTPEVQLSDRGRIPKPLVED